MIFYDSNIPAPNPCTVRQFVLERGGLNLDVEVVDLAGLANRGADYVDYVNSRGEMPALRLDDGSVLTEIVPICEYLDEVAEGESDLIGTTPEERAVTRMWTRRVYLEVCSPFMLWGRGSEAAKVYYQGHRIHAADAQTWAKQQADTGLERLDADLEGRTYIAGDRFSMADILLNAFIATCANDMVIPWLNRPDLKNYSAWRETMGKRPSSLAMMETLPKQII